MAWAGGFDGAPAGRGLDEHVSTTCWRGKKWSLAKLSLNLTDLSLAIFSRPKTFGLKGRASNSFWPRRRS